MRLLLAHLPAEKNNIPSEFIQNNTAVNEAIGKLELRSRHLCRNSDNIVTLKRKFFNKFSNFYFNLLL